MINLADIRKAVNMQLQRTGVPVYSRDVSEGFKRPSFFVQLDNVTRHGSPEHIDRSLTVRIHYFPKDRYEYAIEVLDITDALESLFDVKLKVKDRQFNIHDFDSSVSDGVLQCYFDIEFSQARGRNIYDPEDVGMMEGLELTIEMMEQKKE
ncbi:hypothetical protein LGV96_09885 [Streptococcus mutans]|nr:hypothetical protein [Streptococcus mutans]MCB5031949.1 hypothetical protein [Streptococcus mutans]MCB5145204.1 hypothetical protein [Streptococcus mutans]